MAARPNRPPASISSPLSSSLTDPSLLSALSTSSVDLSSPLADFEVGVAVRTVVVVAVVVVVVVEVVALGEVVVLVVVVLGEVVVVVVVEPEAVDRALLEGDVSSVVLEVEELVVETSEVTSGLEPDSVVRGGDGVILTAAGDEKDGTLLSSVPSSVDNETDTVVEEASESLVEADRVLSLILESAVGWVLTSVVMPATTFSVDLSLDSVLKLLICSASTVLETFVSGPAVLETFVSGPTVDSFVSVSTASPDDVGDMVAGLVMASVLTGLETDVLFESSVTSVANVEGMEGVAPADVLCSRLTDTLVVLETTVVASPVKKNKKIENCVSWSTGRNVKFA